MAKTVLCLSNVSDTFKTKMAALAGTDEYEVTHVTTVTEAEKRLAKSRYNLLIMEVMIPVRGSAEMYRYPPSETDCGHKTGLIFYRHNREILGQAGTLTVILTIRTDRNIKQSFIDSGLPADQYLEAADYQEIGQFISKISELLAA